MGKTNLLPSMTYFTDEELAVRKKQAKEAGLSISNFNRMELGYPLFKQGKPKKIVESVKTTLTEPNLKTELILEDEFLEILPTESDLENAFADISTSVLKFDEINPLVEPIIESLGEQSQPTADEIVQPSLF